MRNGRTVAVVIPALDEAGNIANVIAQIPPWVDDIVVADNGSTDGTPEAAQNAGARVAVEPQRGYGAACLCGIAALEAPDIVVFLDGDHSDYPEQMDRLVDPIVADEAEFVVGSRTRGRRAPGALTLQARFGNRLACFLLRLFWNVKYTDLGPFRAIRYDRLQQLAMADRGFGWTVEMQIKAALHRLPVQEVPVDYRPRPHGKSKVSGTLRGIFGAAYKILTTIFGAAGRHYIWGRPVRQELIVFTRYPEPGVTKTRLIPALGEEGAADLQRQMTERMLRTARRAGVQTTVRYTGAGEDAMIAWLGKANRYARQGDGDLGARLIRGFNSAFDRGFGAAIAVGSDCPEITPGILHAAFTKLRSVDVVLGPAVDGGYYLIGMRGAARSQAVPNLFEGPEWGTGAVYAETLRLADKHGLSVTSLAYLEDVDRPEDLPIWDRAQQPEPDPAGAAITVIIPALNEEGRIEDTIRSAAADPHAEILVVDGGSTDNTPAAAVDAGATVVHAAKGRAHQLNVGSAKATGSLLLFVHADTRLPEDYGAHVRRMLTDPRISVGAFRFATPNRSPAFRVMGWWANARSRWLGMPYGDQGLFIRKNHFREAGGFEELPIMDDFEFARRMRRYGKVRIAPAAAVTSDRRWRRMGLVRTFLTNQLVVLGYALGISAEHLARFYHRTRGLR